MQRGWKRSSRINTSSLSRVEMGSNEGTAPVCTPALELLGNLLWSLQERLQCWPETNRLPDISPANMQEKHRAAIQGLPPWQDTFKFPNNNGKRNLLKKKKERLSMSTTNWHLPYTSTRIRSSTDTAADFQHSLNGVQGREQKWGILCSGKNWENRSSDN